MWDGAAVCGAIVRKFDMDDGQRWLMWYGGRPREWDGAKRVPPGLIGCFAGLATSSNGVNWKRVQGPSRRGAVLEPNTEDWWWFDTAHLAFGHVDIMSNSLVRADGGVYFAYYSGGDTEAVCVNDQTLPGARTRIGIALSKDGEHWTRIEGDHPSGAVLEPGEADAFDALGVLGPTVVEIPSSSDLSPGYLMYYFAFDTASNTFAIGRARSADGFRFDRDANGAPVLSGSGPGSGAIDEKGVSRCCIVRRDNADRANYVMFVEVIDAHGIHRIAVAESHDALAWSPRRLVLDVASDDNQWDSGSVSHPHVVVVEGQAWLYYTGQRTCRGGNDTLAESCIGLAVSRGSDWTTFDRISR